MKYVAVLYLEDENAVARAVERTSAGSQIQITAVADNMWDDVDVEVILPGDHRTPEPKEKRAVATNGDRSIAEQVLDAYRQHGPTLSTPTVRLYVNLSDRQQNTINTVQSMLCRQGKLKRIATATYTLQPESAWKAK